MSPVGINYVDVIMVSNSDSNINLQGITTTSWQKISSNGGCTGFFNGSDFNGRASGNCNSWSVDVKITATNICGTTTIYQTITPPAATPCFTINLVGDTIIIKNPCNNTNGNNIVDLNLVKSLYIYDLNGNIIQLNKSNKYDISSLNSGIYIVKIEFLNGVVISKKIIK